ncbi:MAG: LysR family transcriptional regulator [Pseudobdellovibrionaceae bacterium]
MAMDWDKLKAFYAVAEVGSFTHAGEKLQLSQSAISRQISGLEESLGVTLFHRHARGLILTEQGELLFDSVQSIFRQLSLIEGQLQDSKTLAQGPLLITVAEFVGSVWLAPLVPLFHKEYPDIRLSVVLEDRVLNLGMREADAAIRLYKPEQQDLIQRKLGHINFQLCASEGYLKEHGTPKSFRDLKDHTLIGHPIEAPAPFDKPNWHFEAANINIQQHPKALFMNSMNGIMQAVIQGCGIASVPEKIIRKTPGLVSLLTDKQTHVIEIFFVYPEEHKNSKRISLLRDFLMEHMNNPLI